MPATASALHSSEPPTTALNDKRVRFAANHSVRTFTSHPAAFITFDLGADGHYVSEKDRKAAGLPILKRSTKCVGVANGCTSQAKHVTKLPFNNLSSKAQSKPSRHF